MSIYKVTPALVALALPLILASPAAAHSATNASTFKNLSADDLADSLSIFLPTDQRINVWDRGDFFLLHFK